MLAVSCGYAIQEYFCLKLIFKTVFFSNSKYYPIKFQEFIKKTKGKTFIQSFAALNY